jgi:hypothetical protein
MAAAAGAVAVLASARAAAQDDILSHFKYGSVGTEAGVGIPYRVWRVLPVVFADKLPARPGTGYERIGFLFEPNSPQGRPVGTSYQDGRVPLVGLNCATCHAGRVRDAAGGAPRIIAGMPAHQMDLQGFANFLTATARDERFNASTLIAAMRQQDPEMSWLDSLLHRFVVIPRTQKGILDRATQNAWFADRPPGRRVDTLTRTSGCSTST